MDPLPEPFRVLVVDDEALARKRLTDLLARDPDVDRILEAQDGVAAVSLIQEEQPDVVFLDVQMPGVDGFGVINAVGVKNMPLTVFVTGYDEFAIRAFETDAADYLLKPFVSSRYELMMARVKKRLRESASADINAFGQELQRLTARQAPKDDFWHWIVVKARNSTRLVMVEDIDWIQAAGMYVTLHAGGEEFLYRGGLAAVAGRLDPHQFVRIHKSSVVNLKSIARLERLSHADFGIVLKDGTQLRLSRIYRDHFEEMLGQPL